MLLAAIATGCDNIAEDDRYIMVEKPSVSRNLLIMEFTGNDCPNCPNGMLEVEKIKQEQEAGRVISVGLHPYGSNFTVPMFTMKPTPHFQDLRSDAATALFEYYMPGGFPAAVFNGRKSSLSTSVNFWQQRAAEAIAVRSSVSLSATASYDDSSRELTVDYDIDFLDDISTRLNVTVWLVENDILGVQHMPDDKTNDEYVHNHVLRASLNGNWGEEIGNFFAAGSSHTGTASMKLKEDWVAKNCNVVVYVYRENDKYVEQAISLEI